MLYRPMRALTCLALIGSVLAPSRLDAGQTSGNPAPEPQATIVAAQGRVERAAGLEETWNTATVFDKLFVQDRVRTFDASRAAILFLDETQVKLNANAVLTVEAVRTGAGAPTTFELLRGEGWFRTKNPASGLTIRTPTAAAAIRGTEINVALGPDDTTVVTVVEGSAELSNPEGSLLIDAGEEGTARPGQAPTKRVVLDPEDAVQWALYYPARVAWHDLPAAALAGTAAPGFARLQAGDPDAALAAFLPVVSSDGWARVGASMAYLRQGDSERAREVLAGAVNPEVDLERRAQRAAIALAIGDARAARAEIDDSLAIDGTAMRPLVLLSTLELTQNHPDLAGQAAAAALGAHPESVAALVAASEAAQATFDLERAQVYLDRALALDPDDVAARVNRARLRFGTGDTSGARVDIEAATRVATNDAQALSMSGFILLADGRRPEAQRRFEAAVSADPELGEPHLGLGLIHFREGRVHDGLLELLTATLLEPKVSLYQSYLGKAYYQAARFPEGLAALASAKRLDPRDPTPWLYTSLFLRDQNRQVDALEELRRAIALNDNRAVYRSRLLLDRDLATKNVSLAEIYGQLGFDAWGASEAQSSLEADFTNASAHLFLADTYGRLPDRTQALGSEVLQYQLYAPVNRNSFNNFNEYTALLEQPDRQLSPIVRWGSDGQADGVVQTRSGNERFAHLAAVEYSREDGVRLQGDDEYRSVFLQSKLALSARSDILFAVNSSRQSESQIGAVVRTFGLELDAPVIIRQYTDAPDRNLVNRFSTTNTRIGFKHSWRPGSAFTATTNIQRYEQRTEDPDETYSVCGGLELTQYGTLASARRRYPFRSYDIQGQQATRIGRHQVIVGAQLWEQDKESHCIDSVYLAASHTPVIDLRDDSEGHDRTVTGYVRDEIGLAPWLHVTLGLRRDHVTYVDLFDQQPYRIQRWNPMAGASITLGPATVVRVAGLRNLNSDFTGAKISPATVSGFTIERNEEPTAIRKEGDVSLEQSWPRAFLNVRGFIRDTTVPALASLSFLPEAQSRDVGMSTSLNLIGSRRVGLFADDLFVRTETRHFDRTDNRIRVGINFIHERGLLARVSTSYVTQRFSNSPVRELPQSGFALTDLDLRYEFAGKRGLFRFTVTNVFNRSFIAAVEGLSIDRLRPDRRALVSLRWRI